MPGDRGSAPDGRRSTVDAPAPSGDLPETAGHDVPETAAHQIPERAADDREIGEELARWGRVLLLETRGRLSGRPIRTAVGFVEADDGALLVAAGDPDADWARNLEADPRCQVTIGERTEDRVAESLDGAEHHAAVVALILRYGTPAERLGAGPAFRLVRDPASSDADRNTGNSKLVGGQARVGL